MAIKRGLDTDKDWNYFLSEKKHYEKIDKIQDLLDNTSFLDRQLILSTVIDLINNEITFYYPNVKNYFKLISTVVSYREIRH